MPRELFKINIDDVLCVSNYTRNELIMIHDRNDKVMINFYKEKPFTKENFIKKIPISEIDLGGKHGQ